MYNRKDLTSPDFLTSTTHCTSHKHCEYQSFEYRHVHGATHCVGPVHPIPPHCPQRCAGDDVVAGGVVDVVLVVEVLNVVGVAVVVGTDELLEVVVVSGSHQSSQVEVLLGEIVLEAAEVAALVVGDDPETTPLA